MEIIKRADLLIISKLTWPSFYFNRSKMEGELRLVSKKKTTSAVWVHFGIAVDEDGKATTEMKRPAAFASNRSQSKVALRQI